MRLIDGDYLYDELKSNGIENMYLGSEVLNMVKEEPTIDSIPKADYETRLKADMVDMLEDLKQDIIAEAYGIEMDCTDYVVNVADIDKVIYQKINTLRNNGNEEDEKVNN